MDCVSVFARTVELAFKVLEAAIGYDPRDPYSRQLDLIRQSWGTSLRWSGQVRDWSYVDTVHLNPDTHQNKEPKTIKKTA